MSARADLFAPFESLSLDKKSGKPIYVQIADGIASLLEQGFFPAGFLLPAERVLCEQYSVSRMTLRQAMSVLERKGLIESHRGRGTFVAPKRLQKQEQELRSFSEEIRNRGGKPHSRLISFGQITPKRAARDFFGLPEGEKVYEICRLRLKDETPLALESVQVPLRIAPWLERFDLANNSLYRIFEESYGLRLESSIEEISAELPSAADRKLLALPKNVAVLLINRKTFGNTGAAIELSRSTYRGDVYSAIVHSVRKRKIGS
jgi:GntR family transcriptional regulator